MVRDPEFGAVRVRAFGAFALQVVEPRALLVQLAGTDPDFRTDEVEEYLRQLITGRVGTALATAGVRSWISRCTRATSAPASRCR